MECQHCHSEVGTVYASEGHWFCESCFEELLSEKLLPTEAKKRLINNKKK